MSEIKQVILVGEKGSKGYSWSAFKKRLQIEFQEIVMESDDSEQSSSDSSGF